MARTPAGASVIVPATAQDDFAYFQLDQPEEIRRYYVENGYVVVRNLIPAEACRAARKAFADEVKPYKGFIYRQTTASPERHTLGEHGYMMNPILNVQSLDPRSLSAFRRAALNVITHSRLQQAVQVLLGEPGKLVQSMFFEGNSATPAHQDTYYLDAEEIGRMVAAWVAVEDIAPGAGRFFIYPKSHLLPLVSTSGDMDVVFNPPRYKEHVLDNIARNQLECRAPALGEGDVLLWSSKTIHGSLATTEPERSRSSFTSHFIPESSRFLQWQSRVKALSTEKINGVAVHKPKDLALTSNRAVLWVETTFPRAFQLAKKTAVKLLT
jgi:phytanoyl-CoA hydroxylase